MENKYIKKALPVLLFVCLIIALLSFAAFADAGTDYTVTFAGNEGLPATSDSTGTILGTELPDDPVRQGFLFNGWNTAQDGSGAVFTAKTAVTADITVYAQWKNDGFSVYYNANGGTPAVSEEKGSVNGPIFPAEPIREGYNFLGYNTKANGSGIAFTGSTPVTGPLTVYAQWEAIEYTVTFNGAGGNPWNPADAVAVGTIRGTTFPATTPTRDGYLFAGWSTSAGGAADFTPSTPVNANMTVYAVWAEDGYTVCFFGNGGSPAKTTAIGNTEGVTLPANPTREGYTFGGWYKDAAGNTPFFAANPVTADMSLYAIWELKTFNVTFEGNGGTPENTVKKGCVNGTALPQQPTKEGYQFVQWNTKADGTGSQFTSATPVSGPLTVYAVWSPYYVKFDANGGELQINDSKAMIYDHVLVCLVQKPDTGNILMPDIYQNKPGYVFEEWNTEADGSGTVFTGSTPITENMTVYAIWEKSSDTYTVTFTDDYGGTFANGEQTITAQGSVDGVDFSQEPTRAGYKFAYYSSSGKIYTESTPITDDITLYANYILAYTPGPEDWTVSAPTYSQDAEGNGTETLRITAYTGSDTSVTMPSWYEYDGDIYTVEGNSQPKFEGSPNTITYKLIYGDSLFENNGNIVSVTMPDKLTEIPGDTFYNCVSLQTVFTPSSVEYVGNQAFRACISLTGLDLPESVEGIGSFAFAECIRLQDITASDDTTLPAGLDAVYEYAFFRSGISGDLNFSSLDCLDEFAFTYCENLTGVTFGNDINQGAYDFCNANDAFRGCTNLGLLNLGELTEVPYDMFLNSGIESLVIPSTVTAIGQNAFAGCDRLTSISFPSGTTTVGSSSGAQFYDCDRLIQIDFPASVTKIEKTTFGHCDSLETVILPAGLTTLGQSAFAQCYALHDVTIPETLNSLNCPFYYDYNLTSIYYPMETPPTVSSSYEYTNYHQYNGTGTKLYYPVTGNAAWEAVNPVTSAYFPSPSSSNFWFPVSNVTLHNYDGSTTEYRMVLNRFTLLGTSPEPLIREGMNFLGWSTVEGDTSTIFNFTNTPVTADLELYDCWEYTSYEISFINAYNNGLFASGGTDADGTTDLPTTDPTREGYHFAGWNTASDGTGEFITASTVFTEDTDVYSVWTSAYYTVQFLANGGSPFIANAKGSLEGTALPTNIMKTGYTLSGWKKSTGEVFASTTPVTEAVSVYAQWTENSYGVTFNGNGGTPASTAVNGGVEGLTPPADPTLANYTFTGWNTAAGGSGSWYAADLGISANTIFYAQWQKRQCSVTFNAQGGEFGSGDSELENIVDYSSKISPPDPAPAKSGYVLISWYKDIAYTDEWDFASDTVTENMILFARWLNSADIITLAFDAQGGTVSPDEKNAVKGELCGELPAPARTGYVFAGWYSQEQGGGVLYTESSAVPDENLTLYAKWIKLYTVSFNTDASDVENPDDMEVAVGAQIGTLPTLTRSGYTFGGWYSQTNGGGTQYTSASIMPENDLTLYAKWTAVSSGGGGSSTKADSGTVTTEDSETTSTISTAITGTTTGGKTTASLTANDASKLVQNAQSAEASGQEAVIEIKMETAEGAKAAAVTIPKTGFDELANSTDAKLKVDAGIIKLKY